jgi:hypothetical protein
VVGIDCGRQFEFCDLWNENYGGDFAWSDPRTKIFLIPGVAATPPTSSSNRSRSPIASSYSLKSSAKKNVIAWAKLRDGARTPREFSTAWQKPDSGFFLMF